MSNQYSGHGSKDIVVEKMSSEELQFIASLPEIANTSTSDEEFISRCQTRLVRTFGYKQLATWHKGTDRLITLSGFQSNYPTTRELLNTWLDQNMNRIDESLQTDKVIMYSDSEYNYALIPHRKRHSVFGISMLKKSLSEKILESEIKLIQIYGNQYAVVFENSKLQEGSTVDALTKLFNAKFFHNRIVSELLIAEQTESPLSLLLFDIDHFKKFNDTYGHTTGDLVLNQVAGVVKKVCRSSDIVCRYGGEEFAVILIDTDTTGAKIVAEKIRKAVETYILDPQRAEIKVTISIGIATFPEHASDKDSLINHTDQALYSAKKSGRNCSKTYSDKN